MKNYFESGDGHLTNQMASQWFTDIAETFNKTFKRQMDMSIELSNQLMKNPITKENSALSEDNLGSKIIKSNTEVFRKNMEMFSDLSKKMMGFTFGMFSTGKETNSVSEKISESVIAIYEKQIKQIKEFNSNVLETIEKNPGEDTAILMKNFKKNIEDNMDSSMEIIKTLLKPDTKNSEYMAEANKKMLDEITRQIDLASKSAISFWSDFMTSIGQVSKGAEQEMQQGKQVIEKQVEKQQEKQQETRANAMKEFKKEEPLKLNPKR